MKKIEKTQKLETLHVHALGKLILVKVCILLKMILRLKEIPIKNTKNN